MGPYTETLKGLFEHIVYYVSSQCIMLYSVVYLISIYITNKNDSTCWTNLNTNNRWMKANLRIFF